MGGATDGAAVSAPRASSAPMGQAVAESGASHPAAVAGLWVGTVAPRRLGGAGGHPVAARLDGECALLTPPSARNTASGKLFRPLSWACPGGIFVLKAGSWRGEQTIGVGMTKFK